MRAKANLHYDKQPRKVLIKICSERLMMLQRRNQQSAMVYGGSTHGYSCLGPYRLALPVYAAKTGNRSHDIRYYMVQHDTV